MTASTATTLNAHEWAVEVDTVLAQLWGAQEGVAAARRSTIESLHYAVGHHRAHYGRSAYYWAASRNDLRTHVTPQDAVDKAVAMVADPETKPWTVRDLERDLQRLAEQDAETEALGEAVKEFQAEWNELRWSRFFLVRANNGHIHSSMACQTCNRNGYATAFGWLPNLSGLTEAEAVAEHGTILCSVCFPSAPVEWTLGKQVDTSNDCPISGKGLSQLGLSDEDRKARVFWRGSGGYVKGECPGGCGNFGVVFTSTGKIRKHKKKGD